MSEAPRRVTLYPLDNYHDVGSEPETTWIQPTSHDDLTEWGGATEFIRHDIHADLIAKADELAARFEMVTQDILNMEPVEPNAMAAALVALTAYMQAREGK